MGRFRALGTRPWLRAPLLLRREYGVTLAVALASLILALTAAGGSLYVDSVGNAALAQQVQASCAPLVTPYVGYSGPLVTPVGTDAAPVDFAAIDRDATTELSAVPYAVGTAQPTLASQAFQVGGTPAAAAQDVATAALLAKPDFAQHIAVVSDAGGSGVWVPDTLAAQLDVHAGGSIAMALGDATAGARIRGVYRDLTYSALGTSALAAFWCAPDQLPPHFFADTLGNSAPPPALLVDRTTFLALDARLHTQQDSVFWPAPLPSTLDLAQADVITSYVGKAGNAGGLVGSLPQLTSRAHAIRDSVAGATQPITVAGGLVALLLVAGAGLFWAERRRTEIRLLSSRGVGPVALGFKAGLEVLPATVVGGVAGWLLALLLIGTVAPSPTTQAGANVTALERSAVALAVGLVLVAVVAGLRSRAEVERPLGRRRSRLRLIPWELLLVGAAVAVRLSLSRPELSPDSDVPELGLGLLAFPLLLLLGGVLFASRLAGLLLGLARRRRLGRQWSAVPWLVVRRLTGESGVALAVLFATAIPVGVLTYAGAVSASARATLAAKIDVFVGARSRVSAQLPPALPAGLPGRNTEVLRLDNVTAFGQSVDVLAVDPRSWPQVIAWHASYSPSSLPTLMSDLDGPTSAVAVDFPTPVSGTADVSLGGNQATLHVSVRGTADSVPGLNGDPVLLVDARAVGGPLRAAGADTQVWSDQPSEVIVPALADRRLRPTIVVDSAAVLDVSVLLPESWTFDYLRALGFLTGAVGASGLLLQISLRQRSQALATVLTRRMGLGPWRQLGALLAELGLVTAVGGVLGGVVTGIATGSVYRYFDVDPQLPPEPLLALPTGTLLGTAAALVVVVVVAATFAQRRAAAVETAGLLRG